MEFGRGRSGGQRRDTGFSGIDGARQFSVNGGAGGQVAGPGGAFSKQGCDGGLFQGSGGTGLGQAAGSGGSSGTQGGVLGMKMSSDGTGGGQFLGVGGGAGGLSSAGGKGRQFPVGGGFSSTDDRGGQIPGIGGGAGGQSFGEKRAAPHQWQARAPNYGRGRFGDGIRGRGRGRLGGGNPHASTSSVGDVSNLTCFRCKGKGMELPIATLP